MSKTASATRSTPILWPNGRDLPRNWDFVPFGEVAEIYRSKEMLVPDRNYDLIGMRWYAKGPYIKERLPGSVIKATHLYTVQEGAFIYNRLFAWKGSFGVIDATCAHGLVSGEFPVFRTAVVEDAYYLWFLFSQPWAWQMLEDRSNGATSTSRLRLKEDDLLKFQIPLPGKDERLTMVRKVMAHLRNVEAAKSAAAQQLEAVESLAQAIIRHAFNGV